MSFTPFTDRESREKNWKQIQFHLFADDIKKCKRSDAAIYYVIYSINV